MRLFLASTFPSAVTRELHDRIQAIKGKLPPASWVRPESQHLTYAFLGEQPESLIDVLTPLLANELARVTTFEATLRGSGFFPSARRPRVGWVGVDPEAKFIALAAAVREAVTRAKLTLDRDTFKPHLTLMRLRENWPPASVQLFERTLRDYRSAPFAVDRVTLYSSALHPTGAVHTALRELPLA